MFSGGARCFACSSALLAVGVEAARIRQHESDVLAMASGDADGPATAWLDKWEQYVNDSEASPLGLQPDCRPQHYQAEGDVYKGVAVLFHGFTACPQQWFDIARALSKKGYEVLLPLTPGHGNIRPPPAAEGEGHCSPLMEDCGWPNVDDITSLPDASEGYKDFVKKIGDIVRLAPQGGKHVVAGLSLGGALAAYAGQEMRDDGTALYSRQLIMNPLLKPAHLVAGAILDLVGQDRNHGRHGWVGWGKGCEAERDLGRAGICTFKVESAYEANEFGKHALSSAKLPEGAAAAVIYDKADPVTSNTDARALARKFEEKGGEVQTCVLPFTSHSMLSKYDDARTNKWFIPALSCWVISYLADGAAMPQQAEQDMDEDGANICDIGCDIDTSKEFLHSEKGDVPLWEECSS